MASFGYAGVILQVNLSSGQFTKLPTADYAGRFLGGRGIAAKIYWDKTTPETQALGPENSLIFITGPLAGFTRLAGCRWQVCGKSPEMQPEAFSYANLGGSWGAWLKFAGYDGIVVEGQAERPVYLYLDGAGQVELRDARALWGKTVYEAQEALSSELGLETRILTIGPAGENLVTFATIQASDFSSGGSGFGAVMGSKKLKAIVVNAAEKRRPLAARPEELRSLANQVAVLNARNLEEGRQSTLTGTLTACFGCVSGCSRRTYHTATGGKFRSFCQATLVYLEQTAKSEEGAEVARYATRLCDTFGLDTTVMEPLIRWLALCFRGGILNEAQTGLPLAKMGSAEFIEVLVRIISRREGFGDVLARGTLEAASAVGPEAQKLIGPGGVVTKASETKDYDPRLILANALIYATEPRRAIQQLHAIAFPLRRWVWWHDKLKGAFLSTEVFQTIAERYWGSAAAGDLSGYEGKALAAKMIQDYAYVRESLILCDLTWPIYQVHLEDPPIGLCELESKIVSAATGHDLDAATLMKAGERTFNLQRAILLLEGWPGRKGDTLLEYLHEEPLQSVYWSAECLVPGGHGQVVSRKGAVVDRAKFEEMKSEYYSLRGWDAGSGLLAKAKLAELDLVDISKRLEKQNLVR